MKINRNISYGLDNILLQGYDLSMLQQVVVLSGRDLDEYIRDYAMDNPALRVIVKDEGLYGGVIEVEQEKSLYSYLVEQIEVMFSEDEKQEARDIAGNLDGNGFYDGEKTEVVRRMQYLDPVGIVSSDAREAMMVQLREKGMERTLAFEVLEKYYVDFLNRNFDKIGKKMGESREVIEGVVEEIVLLNPFPGRGYGESCRQYIIPEMRIEYEDRWHLIFERDFYPRVELVKRGTAKQVSDAMRFIFQLNRRKERLEKIVSEIVKVHHDFLLEGKSMGVLTRKSMLGSLDISESMFSRILTDKHIMTPMGVYSLAHFFSVEDSGGGRIAVEKAKKILEEIISGEDVKKPYTDSVLQEKLEQRGVSCSRRRVAKYRKMMMIPGAYHRASR